jgi:ATP-binding cassette subfamily B multidrug efflux pump
VDFQNVAFSYHAGTPVIRDFSLSIPAGTRVAIVGPTGSGKTTLINLLTRFYDVDAGNILLDGRDLRDYRMTDLRSAFGVVLQDTALFPPRPPERTALSAACPAATTPCSLRTARS